MAVVDSLDQEQISQLISGRGKLAFVPMNKDLHASDAKSHDYSSIVNQLNGASGREEARSALRALPNRDAVASVARLLKVHIIKQDKREEIETKIVEFIIGGKLRTEAIRSLNFKRSGHRRAEE